MAKNLFAPVTELWDEPKSPTVKLIDTTMSADLKKSTQAANEHVVLTIFPHLIHTYFKIY